MCEVGCAEWTFLAFLVLLARSCPVRSECCHDDNWSSSRSFDLEALGAANATLVILGIFQAPNRDTCADLCCQNSSGNCTMAVYHSQKEIDSCHLYNCLPLHLCFLTRRIGIDTLLAPAKEVKRGEPATTPAAVHGDGTQSKGRKGVLSLEVENVPLKHDNTSVKPRKGVLKEHLVNTVKARKGVENETITISTDLFSDDATATNISRDDSVELTSPVVVRLEDLVSNVSQAENNATESNIMWYENPVNSSTDELTNITLILFTNSSSSVSSSNKDTDDSNTAVHTTTVPSTTTKSTLYMAHLKENVHSADQVKAESQDIDQVSDWEAENGANAINLVIGLVLGLMLLLTVLGIVAKRIHDSWQRRHYHRMDFLIDGMYHGDP